MTRDLQHFVKRWRKDGKVVARCGDITTHSRSTTYDYFVTCESCLRGMARDDVAGGRPPRNFFATKETP